MKLQMTPVFGGIVVATGGISVSYANGVYTFSLEGADPITIAGDSAIDALTAAVAIARVAPVTTNLQLPDVNLQSGIPLSIFDFSTAVVAHAIVITPFAGQTIMRQANWTLNSAGAVLSSVTLRPAKNLSTWYIA